MTNPFQVLQDVADAVVAQLNAGNAAGSFSMTFSAARTYDTELDLDESKAGSLNVDVAYGIPDITPVTIISDGLHCPIDICVRKKVLISDTNTIDSLVAFTGELWAYLAGGGTDGLPRSLSTYNAADWEDPRKEDMPVPCVHGILKESNLYVGIISASYVVHL